MDNFKRNESDKYGGGILLDEYNGSYSLVNAKQTEDGKIFKDWVFPARYDKQERCSKPIEKSTPWKLTIGSSPEEAIETLRYFIGLLDGTKSYEPHSAESAPGYSGPPVDDGGDIPF